MQGPDEHFVERVRQMAGSAGPAGVSGVAAPAGLAGAAGSAAPAGLGLPAAEALELFEVQIASRHLDLVARELRARNQGFYTIRSAGHEGNAAVAAALRPTDPAMLHYRSGAFYLQRAGQVPGIDGERDILLGLVGAAGEPIAGGRHKVFGRGELHVVPQTSTIASHAPRAMGTAFSISLAAKLGVPTPWPTDAVVVASFGDASMNHSTAAGAVNAALQVAHRGLPMPLLIVCEDNGLGLSVPNPPGWIAAAYAGRTGLRYLQADGANLPEALAAARDAAEYVRRRRRPTFLHLRTVRLMGHAGSDVESAYRPPSAIAADLDRDPLLGTARWLVQAGVLRPDEVLDRYEAARERVRRMAREVAALPRLAGREQVMGPLAPRRPAEVARVVPRAGDDAARSAVFGRSLPEEGSGRTLAQSINAALHDVLAAHPGALVFGEDVARKGGVYGVTRGLRKAFGPARVFDTILDEQTILGVALGAGLSGLLPIPEIQYLAYLHNAEDQLRGEAATLQFFSTGAYRNPMVVRIAGYGYQKGFGGHFHNDNSVAVLRDIPGLVVASPARAEDAAAMLRTLVAAGLSDGTVSAFVEPIALYHTRDLHTEGDGLWTDPYPGPDRWAEAQVPIGSARCYGDGADLTLVSWANGLHMSLRVARQLEARGVRARVLDLRWLAPLPEEDLLAAAEATGTVLVVDETRRSGGVSEAVVAALIDGGFTGRIGRVTSADSFVPLGDAALDVLLDEDTILQRALELTRP
ncbi:thiamine pyrophosphate-dependent enzyme [Pseudactinotalea sp. Z1732]|uniref:thiamine pyrophosphate-dependent enzyme n=1 Tax=Micrococcales TaxID=85006 RepID=UPI003C7D4815